MWRIDDRIKSGKHKTWKEIEWESARFAVLKTEDQSQIWCSNEHQGKIESSSIDTKYIAAEMVICMGWGSLRTMLLYAVVGIFVQEIVKTMAMAVNAIRFGQHAKITWLFFSSLLSHWVWAEYTYTQSWCENIKRSEWKRVSNASG